MIVHFTTFFKFPPKYKHGVKPKAQVSVSDYKHGGGFDTGEMTIFNFLLVPF